MVARRSLGQGKAATAFQPEIGDSESETKARRGVGVDLPAFYAGQRSGPFTLEDEKMQALTEADRELFWLAFEVNNCAETARSLVVGESDYAVADLETAKAVEARRMRRMLHAWYGFREESEAPYRDARMLLTKTILGQAGTVRLQRASDVPPPPPDVAKAALDAAAGLVCRIVAALYPTLASQLRDPSREARIRAAIESAASTEKRTPWVLIAAVWKGIEKGDPDPERWRKDWHEYQQSLRP